MLKNTIVHPQSVRTQVVCSGNIPGVSMDIPGVHGMMDAIVNTMAIIMTMHSIWNAATSIPLFFYPLTLSDAEPHVFWWGCLPTADSAAKSAASLWLHDGCNGRSDVLLDDWRLEGSLARRGHSHPLDELSVCHLSTLQSAASRLASSVRCRLLPRSLSFVAPFDWGWICG